MPRYASGRSTVQYSVLYSGLYTYEARYGERGQIVRGGGPGMWGKCLAIHCMGENAVGWASIREGIYCTCTVFCPRSGVDSIFTNSYDVLQMFAIIFLKDALKIEPWIDSNGTRTVNSLPDTKGCRLIYGVPY